MSGLGYCAFARHYLRNRCLLSLPAGTEMFQFPAFAPHNVVSGSLPTGFPIRTSAGHSAFAAHRRFSQLVTSFVASESHRHPPCALVRFSFLFPVDLHKPRFLLDSRLWMASRPSQCELLLTKKVVSRSQHVNDLVSVVPGRLELPTSTLSV